MKYVPRLAAAAWSVMLAAVLQTSPAWAVELPTTRLLPVVPGEEATRSTPFIAWFQDLSADRYVEEEYEVSGAANLYGYIDDIGMRPEVTVVMPDIPYTTRILVRRPTKPGRFNGTVYVEVLNATAGWDGDPIWQSTSEFIIREGAIWVGVSTKPVTVSFLRDRWGRPPTWPLRNASRYENLSMPAFGQVWDMLTQIGALLKTPDASENPLAAFQAKRLIMVGYSQSAAYQTTYANSFHDAARMPDGTTVYDGYYISAGGARAKHATGPASAPENLATGDARNLIRVDAPVIRFQTQTEVVNFPSYTVRQTGTAYPLLRTYEMAGGSHVDSHLGFIGGQALVRDLGLPPSFCPSPANPLNPIRIGYVQAAAMKALDLWIARGITPPSSRLLELTTDPSTGATVLARDANGNAIGGVRGPAIDTPLGAYVESNSGPGFCGLFGGFRPFEADKVAALYPTHGAYVRQFVEAAVHAVWERFLLPRDAATLIRDAARSDVGK